MSDSKTDERIRELAGELVILHEREDEIIDELRSLIGGSGSAKGVDPSNKRIDVLCLSTKVYNCLIRRGYNALEPERPMNTIADILSVPQYGWRKIRNFGKASAIELEEKMHEAGYPEFRVDFAHRSSNEA